MQNVIWLAGLMLSNWTSSLRRTGELRLYPMFAVKLQVDPEVRVFISSSPLWREGRYAKFYGAVTTSLKGYSGP